MERLEFRRGELYSIINAMAVTEVNRRLQKNFKNAGIEITVEQWSVLYHLWKQDGQSQLELSKKTNRDKTSTTRLIDNLEELDLVIRKNNIEDKRSKNIFLTQKAKDLHDATIKVANETLSEALDGISKKEIALAKLVLQKVFDNLTKLN